MKAADGRRLHKSKAVRCDGADSFAREQGNGGSAGVLLSPTWDTGWRRHLEIRSRAVASVHGRRSEGARRGPPQPTSRRRSVFRVRPDFVFPKLKIAVFVDGCFWHACPKHATQPKNNAEFWQRKLDANKARDRLVTRTLKQSGWRVIRIWEHALAPNETRLVSRLQAFFRPDAAPTALSKTP